MSPSGIQVNKKVVLVIVLFTIGIIIYKNYNHINTFLKKKKTEMAGIPQDALDKAKTVKCSSRNVKIQLEKDKVCMWISSDKRSFSLPFSCRLFG